MSDYLRSAFNNFSSNWNNNGSDEISHHRNDVGNEFVGQTIDLKGHRLKVERVIAEGGFGFVFSVRDLQSQERYALKRLIASGKEVQKEIENEIEVLTKLQPHPHIMKFISWGLINTNIYLILSEYCGRGCLSNLTLPLEDIAQMNRILYQTVLALEQMHRLNIIHRDLKIENVLFDNNGFVKLCDFGSATTNCYQPDHGWTPIQRSLLEDEMTRHTTPMYRPPEILDTYLNYPINIAMDIWAYGCLAYCIKFGRHPFDDSAKLRIINCNYTVPPNIPVTDIHLQIIRSCLKVDPRERVAVNDIINMLEKNFVDLDSPCVRSNQTTPTNPSQPAGSPIHHSSPPPPPPGSAQPTFGLSGFTRYLKDTSSKVMQTVQQSIARQDLDLTYLTSRFIVMSYPAEGLESTYRNHVEDVRAYLDSRRQPYMVVNISGRPYGTTKFGPRVKIIEGGAHWKDFTRPPPLNSILSLCDAIHKWMCGDSKRITVIHCLDGKANSALLSSAYMLWIRLFDDWRDPVNLFAVKRFSISLTHSQERYLHYISLIGKSANPEFHQNITNPVTIKSVIMNGIPLFTKVRDGCRPFLEIYVNNDHRITSTSTEYERLRPYNRASDSRVIWKDLKASCHSRSDVTVIIYHARSSLGSRMLQGKMTAIRMCTVQFNLFFERKINKGTQKLIFESSQVDGIEEPDRYPRDFSVVIEVDFSDSSCPPNNEIKIVGPPPPVDCLSLFATEGEMEECSDLFKCAQQDSLKGTSDDDRTSRPERPPPPAPSIPPIHQDQAIKPERPPPPRPTTRPGESSASSLGPKPNLIQNLDSTESTLITQNGSSSVGSNWQAKKENTLIGDLLNLSLDEGDKIPTNQPSNSLFSGLRGVASTSNGESHPQTDLLIDPTIEGAKTTTGQGANSAFDLLNDIFNSTDKMSGSKQQLPVNQPTNLPKPDLLFPSSATSNIPTSSNNSFNNNNSMSNATSQGLHRNTSTPNLTQLDPLGELGSFMNTATSGVNSSSHNQKSQPQPQGIPRVSSCSTFQPFNSATTNNSSTSGHQQNSSKPDYNRAYFSESNHSASGTGGPRVTGFEFEDLLPNFPKQTKQEPQTKSLAEMKKQEMIREGISPMEIKVNEWKENKKRNIRALLSSLHTIVWEDCNWQQAGLQQLMTYNDVKKMYRKACLAVHPDKLVGTEHEELAKLIFVELNDAWTELEKQEALKT